MQVWNKSPSLELVTMLGRSACAPTSLPFHSESQSAPAARTRKMGCFFMVEAVTRRSVNS